MHKSDTIENETSEVESAKMPSLTTIIGVSVSLIALLSTVLVVGVAIWWKNGNNSKEPVADTVVNILIQIHFLRKYKMFVQMRTKNPEYMTEYQTQKDSFYYDDDTMISDKNEHYCSSTSLNSYQNI